METLLSLAFWFNTRPPRLTPTSQYLLITFIILLVAAALFFYFKKRSKGKNKNFYIKLWRDLYFFSLTNAVIGLLLLFFDSEKIPFFSSRFWYIVWGAVMVVWIYFIYKSARKIPQKIKKAEQEEQYKKYLPQ